MINFTSDITGATSGSGLTSIKIGDKTINLTESSSGSSVSEGCVSGTVTLEDAVNTYTFDTGLSEVNGFVAILDKSFTTQAQRTYSGIIVDFINDIRLELRSNNSGTTQYNAGEYSTNKTSITTDGGSVTITSTNNLTYFGNTTYRWYAW